MEQTFNKLVRDNIPNKIESNGEIAITRILTDEEYKIELEKKLNEELNEVLSSSGKDRLEELADMLEVIKCLAKLEGSSIDEVIDIAQQKKLKRGSFDKKIFLERTIDKR
ncbi:MAG: nucleoside triphosphate pyrophosphohydrolase [Bacilli bacterium]|nr:nucleoside triphosphate pyrophosphohydrolase [Bacilli bacterium]